MASAPAAPVLAASGYLPLRAPLSGEDTRRGTLDAFMVTHLTTLPKESLSVKEYYRTVLKTHHAYVNLTDPEILRELSIPAYHLPQHSFSVYYAIYWVLEKIIDPLMSDIVGIHHEHHEKLIKDPNTYLSRELEKIVQFVPRNTLLRDQIIYSMEKITLMDTISRLIEAEGTIISYLRKHMGDLLPKPPAISAVFDSARSVSADSCPSVELIAKLFAESRGEGMKSSVIRTHEYPSVNWIQEAEVLSDLLHELSKIKELRRTKQNWGEAGHDFTSRFLNLASRVPLNTPVGEKLFQIIDDNMPFEMQRTFLREAYSIIQLCMSKEPLEEHRSFFFYERQRCIDLSWFKPPFSLTEPSFPSVSVKNWSIHSDKERTFKSKKSINILGYKWQFQIKNNPLETESAIEFGVRCADGPFPHSFLGRGYVEANLQFRVKKSDGTWIILRTAFNERFYQETIQTPYEWDWDVSTVKCSYEKAYNPKEDKITFSCVISLADITRVHSISI